MVDSAIILDNIKETLSKIYTHLKVKGLDICLNNVIFKWLVTFFLDSTNETINLPIMDSLLLFGDITLYKASILILHLAEDEILKCNNIGEASIFFDQGIRDFTHKKFTKCLFSKDLFDIKMEDINELRAEKLPRIKENIKQINEYENKKKKQLFENSKCNIDWPYCVQLLGTTKIIEAMKYKIIEKPLIENDYFDVNHNVYKLAEAGAEEHKKALESITKEKDEEKRKTLIYGNLLIERNSHKCNSKISSRNKILGESSRKKSSLMGSFFEACKKEGEDNDNNSYVSDEIIDIISNKNEINHTKYIANILDDNDDNDDKIARRGSWLRNVDDP